MIFCHGTNPINPQKLHALMNILLLYIIQVLLSSYLYTIYIFLISISHRVFLTKLSKIGLEMKLLLSRFENEMQRSLLTIHYIEKYKPELL